MEEIVKKKITLAENFNVGRNDHTQREYKERNASI